MYSRRKNIFLLILLFAANSAYARITETWNFDVYLEDEKIGEHRFEINKTTDGTQVNSKAHFDVYFLFIHAYSYRHQSTETYQKGCLRTIRSETDDNGHEQYVKGRTQRGELYINTANKQYSEKDCVRTFVYWDPELLTRPALLNSQTGELMTVRYEPLGEELLNIKDRFINSRKLRVHSDKFTIDLWYSMDNKWLSLKSTMKDGTTLQYKIR